MPQHQGRPRISGDGRKKAKHTRSSFSNQHKLEVAQHLISCKNVKETLRHFYPKLSGDAKEQRRKLLYERRSNVLLYEERCQIPIVAAMKYVREPGVATVLPREAEAAIVQWVNFLRKDGVPVSATMLRLKGAEVAEDLGIEAFEGSWHWRKGVLRRHRLSIRARSRQGQVTPEAANEAAVNFGIEVQQKMLELRVQKGFNADQTGVFF
ncbi:hypothetical protein PF008_g6809 [Phytophthora fragariae]|uniref:HTH CENPB-type domain-containing protein n=1 Tax=Phytophthora fragariae TaxID=53985 RepID=A0A6G0S647_9STRA|nr:hypothetical protein PF008_g6809 [Phytophthora fragariae]